jgi:protein phosphatase
MKILTILCGIPASGKDYYATQFLHNSIYINADLARGIFGKDQTDQTVNYEVFEFLEYMVIYFMEQGKPISIINTNYNIKNRKSWVELAKKYKYKLVAIVMKTPIEECIRRNELRERKCPVAVIEKMFAGFQAPTLEEGFDEIKYV